MWTLIPLEAMGKLENFKEVFDLEVYRKNAFRWKCYFLRNYGKDGMQTSLIDYAKAHGMKLPPIWVARVIWFMYRVLRKLKLIKFTVG